MNEERFKLCRKLKQDFANIYGSTAGLNFFFAPGRANFMGDHIDYCGGKVLPAALSCGTYLAARVRPSDDGYLYLSSLNGHEPTGTGRFDLASLTYDETNGWTNYPQGVVAEYQKLGVKPPALELLYKGNMPIGSALSSSSSILLATAFAIQYLCDFRHEEEDIVNRRETAFLCHRSENGFNGLNCGTMDQATVALAKEGYLLWLDCVNLECEYIQPDWGDHRILVVNSISPRNLLETAYNERRSEASKCLDILQGKYKIRNLCDLDEPKYEEALELIESKGDRILQRRARHIFTESARVEQSVACLKEGRITEFGKLLSASHSSLKDDYEVAGKAADELVDISMKHPEVIGARMTGGGFTGCTLTLVAQAAIKDYELYITDTYKKLNKNTPLFIDATPSTGVMRIQDQI